MRRLLIFIACAVLWLACATRCAGQPVLTTIQDTLYNLDGSLMNGSIIVTNAAFSVSGIPIAHGTRTFPIRNGVVNIQLAPTDHASPASAYRVSTVSNGLAATSVWSVPTLPSSQCPSGTCTIAQVTTLYTPGPTTTVALSQLSAQGATNGQMICDDAGAASWCNPPASGVGSFNGRTGSVSPAMNDYNFNQLAGTASVGQLPAGIPATSIGNGAVGNTAFGYLANVTSDIQNQLNSTRVKGNTIQADDWCTTSGVYDQTCIGGAVAQLSSGGVVELSDRTYTFSAKLTVSTERVFIAGMNRASKIVAANGLNDDLILFSGCNFCGLAGVDFDGNRTNQSSTSYLLNVTNSALVNIYNNRFSNAHDAAIYYINSTAFDINNFDRLATSIHIVSNTFELNGAGAVVSDAASANGAIWFITANTFRRNGAGGAMSNNSYVALYGPVYGVYTHFNEESDYTFHNGASAIYLVGLDGSGATPSGSAMWNALTTASMFRTTNGASTTNIQQNIPTFYNRSQYYKAVACNGSSPLQLVSTDAAATTLCNNSTGVAEGGLLLPVDGIYAVSDRAGALSVGAPTNHSFGIAPVFFLRNTGGQSGTVHIAMTGDFSCSGNTLPSIASPTWTNIVTAQDNPVNLSFFGDNRVFSLNATNVSISTLAASSCLNQISSTGGFMVRVRRVTYSGGSTNFTGDLYLLGFIVSESVPF